MAITYTGSGDLFIAAALNQILFQLLADKTDLRSLCADMGSVSGSGSLASKVGQVKFADAMAAANVDEVTAPSDVNLTDDSVTITAARQVLVRNVTDLYSLAGGSRPGLQMLAEQMAGAAGMRFTDMVCALFTTVTEHVNSTGVALDVDDIADASYKLIQARVPGPFSAVLAPKQLTDFMDSLRAEGGSATFNPATEQMQSVGANGYGFHGSWRGINFWSADSVPTVSTDRVGSMFGASAFGFVEGIPSEVLALAGPGSFAALTPSGAPIFVEFDRQGRKASTEVIGNYYVGVALAEDEQAVKITSVAS